MQLGLSKLGLLSQIKRSQDLQYTVCGLLHP